MGGGGVDYVIFFIFLFNASPGTIQLTFLVFCWQHGYSRVEHYIHQFHVFKIADILHATIS